MEQQKPSNCVKSLKMIKTSSNKTEPMEERKNKPKVKLFMGQAKRAPRGAICRIPIIYKEKETVKQNKIETLKLGMWDLAAAPASTVAGLGLREWRPLGLRE